MLNHQQNNLARHTAPQQSLVRSGSQFLNPTPTPNYGPVAASRAALHRQIQQQQHPQQHLPQQHQQPQPQQPQQPQHSGVTAYNSQQRGSLPLSAVPRARGGYGLSIPMPQARQPVARMAPTAVSSSTTYNAAHNRSSVQVSSSSSSRDSRSDVLNPNRPALKFNFSGKKRQNVEGNRMFPRRTVVGAKLAERPWKRVRISRHTNQSNIFHYPRYMTPAQQRHYRYYARESEERLNRPIPPVLQTRRRSRVRPAPIPQVNNSIEMKQPVQVPKDPKELFDPINLHKFLMRNSIVGTHQAIKDFDVQVKKDAEYAKGGRRKKIKLNTHDKLKQMQLRYHEPRECESKKYSSRFRGGFALDKLSDADVAFTVHLYQHGFSVNDPKAGFQKYSMENEEFLDSIDAGMMPPNTGELFNEMKINFYEGALVIELRDYRYMSKSDTRPLIRRVLLRPTGESLLYDLQNLGEVTTNFDGVDLDQPNLQLAVESRLLSTLHRNLVLDPSPRVMQVANLVHYNRRQHLVRPLPRIEILESLSLPLENPRRVKPSKPDILTKDDDKYPPNLRKKPSFVLKFAEFVQRTHQSRMNAAHNTLLHDPLFSHTVFNPEAAKPEQAHKSSKLDSKRITIKNRTLVTPPNKYEINYKNTEGTLANGHQVKSVRYETKGNDQVHELFVYPSNNSNRRSRVPEGGISYQGVIRTVSIRDPKAKHLERPEYIKFEIGNEQQAKKFLDQYCDVSESIEDKTVFNSSVQQKSSEDPYHKYREKEEPNFIFYDPKSTTTTPIVRSNPVQLARTNGDNNKPVTRRMSKRRKTQAADSSYHYGETKSPSAAQSGKGINGYQFSNTQNPRNGQVMKGQQVSGGKGAFARSSVAPDIQPPSRSPYSATRRNSTRQTGRTAKGYFYQ